MSLIRSMISYIYGVESLDRKHLDQGVEVNLKISGSDWGLTSMCALAFKGGYPDPVKSNGFLVPEFFETKFIFADLNKHSNLVWSVCLKIRIREAGTPAPQEIQILGQTRDEPLELNPKIQVMRLPVESWQLDLCNKFLNEMLKLSLAYGIEFFRYEEDPDVEGNWSIPLRVKSESLTSQNWVLGARAIGSSQFTKMKRQIEKNLDRRALSNEDLLKVAELYLQELERARTTQTRAKPSKVIAEYFGLLEDGADYRIRQARLKGFLPKTTRKVSASQAGRKTTPKARKEKK